MVIKAGSDVPAVVARAFRVTKLSAVNARGFSIWDTECAAAPAAAPSLGASRLGPPANRAALFLRRPCKGLGARKDGDASVLGREPDRRSLLAIIENGARPLDQTAMRS